MAPKRKAKLTRKRRAPKKSKPRRKRRAAKKKKGPTPAPAVTSEPEFTEEELVVRRRALAAAEKPHDDWNTTDARAVRQWNQIREEHDRWRYYASVPQNHLVRMLPDGVDARVLIDAAREHDLRRHPGPRNAVLYDLAELLPWLWLRAFDRSKKPTGDDDPVTVNKWLEVEERRLKLARQARELVDRSYIRSTLMRAAEPVRNALDSLQRKDPDVYGHVSKALARFFADVEDATRDAEAAD
jgi:hypothetical protein